MIVRFCGLVPAMPSTASGGPAPKPGFPKAPSGTQPPPEVDVAATHTVPSTPGGSATFGNRGDSALTKACPLLTGLKKATYRQMRIRLLTFRSMARRRGADAETDAAFLILNQIQENHFWLAESFNYEELDDPEVNAFEKVLQLLDEGFKYTPEVEIPARCNEFFHSFMRLRDEQLERYNVRYSTQLKLLENLDCRLPEMLRVWHYLSRGGFGEGQWPNIRSMMGAEHTLANAMKATTKMFGAESLPEVRELDKAKKSMVARIEKKGEEAVWYGTEVDDDVYYQYEDEEAWYGDEGWYDDWEDGYYEEEEGFEAADEQGEPVPEELENMANHVDELLVSWMESRKKMQEMAKSRGFYPVFAIPPEVKQTFGHGHDKGKGKGHGARKGGKGKRKSKGKGKGGKGKRKGMEGPPSAGQTASGSNTRHGPRFKRMRDGKESEVNFVEEVEEINMAEDEDEEEITGTIWTYEVRDVPRPSKDVPRTSSRATPDEPPPEVTSEGPTRATPDEEFEEVAVEMDEDQAGEAREEEVEFEDDEVEGEDEVGSRRPRDDYWERDGGLPIRHHVISRRALFTPEEGVNSPVAIDHLSDRRMTLIVYCDDHVTSLREESWKAESRANMVVKKSWKGKSTFWIAKSYKHLYPGAWKTESETLRETVWTTPEDEDSSVILWPVDGEYYKLVRLPGRREQELREKIAEGEAARRELRLLLAEDKNNDMDRCDGEALMVESDTTILDEEDEIALVEEGRVKGVADSGCTTTVCGKEVWKVFLKQKKDSGDQGPIIYHRAARKFRFGNGEMSTATAQAGLEVSILGKKQWIDVFLVPGSTPFLASRKCLEDWGIEVSFSKKAMRYEAKEGEEPNAWLQVPLSKKGHHLLDLLGEERADEAMEATVQSSEDEREDSEVDEDSEDEEETATEDKDKRLEDIEATYMMTLYSDEAEKGSEVASRKRLDEIIDNIWTVHKEAMEKVVESRKRSKKKLTFEIFIDEGKLGKRCSEYPDVEVMQFSIQTGWDFRRAKTRRRMLDWVKEMQPDEVMLAPPCGPWCRWQHINEAWIEGYSEKLAKMREESRRNFLQMTKDIYVLQWKNGRGCHVEQPYGALSWQTPELSKLPGYEADIYQCAFGAKAFDKEGNELGPCQKRTKLKTTSQRMAEDLSRKCQCSQKHVQVRGEHAKKLQNYPDEMIEEMAKLMATCKEELGEACCCHAVSVKDERPDELVDLMFSYMVEAVVHEDEPNEEASKEHLRELRRKFGIHVVRNVLKLHRMLGHPPTRSLTRYLQQAKADGDWVECAKELKCAYCKERERPRAVRVARIPQADAFNELVQMDVFQVQHKGATRKILTIQDVYSKFTIDVPIKRETARTEWKALEDHWFAWAGPPRELRVDSSGGHMSERFKKSCEEKGVKLRIIPHGSHHQLGAVERDHQVRREQMALYQRAFPDDSLRTVLQFTSQQRNRMLNVSGFSPSTLLLGYTPKMPGGHDDFNLAEQARHADVTSKAHLDLAKKSDCSKSVCGS